MRFPIAAMFFIIIGFIFLVFWAVSSYLIDIVVDTMSPLSTTITNNTDRASFQNILAELPLAFGFICVLFFIVGVVLFFVLEANADEPETYWRKY